MSCYLSRHHAGRSASIQEGEVFQCKACDFVQIATHFGLHANFTEWMAPEKAMQLLGDQAHVVQELPLPIWKEAVDVLVAQKASEPEPEPEMDHCPTCGTIAVKSDIHGLPHAHAQCGECREEGARIRREGR